MESIFVLFLLFVLQLNSLQILKSYPLMIANEKVQQTPHFV